MQQIRFYKESTGRWYADLPDYIENIGTHDDLEMVSGADSWLDILSEGETSVTLNLDTKAFSGAEQLKEAKTDLEQFYTDFGATYRIGSYKGVDYSHLTLWLCPVTLYVFGEYPKVIYYTKV